MKKTIAFKKTDLTPLTEQTSSLALSEPESDSGGSSGYKADTSSSNRTTPSDMITQAAEFSDDDKVPSATDLIDAAAEFSESDEAPAPSPVRRSQRQTEPVNYYESPLSDKPPSSHSEYELPRGATSARASTEFKQLFEGIDASSLKDKMYMYMQSIITDKSLARRFLVLLDNKDNEAYLRASLRDTAKLASDQHDWQTGSHEFLPICLTKAAFRRSADLEPRVSSHGKDNKNWLHIQQELRMPTSAVLFKNPESSIRTGHVGVVRDESGKFQTQGSGGFHTAIETAFSQSTSIYRFLTRIIRIYRENMFSGAHQFSPTSESLTLASGRKTDQPEELHQERPEIRTQYKNFYAQLVQLRAAVKLDHEPDEPLPPWSDTEESAE
jgi:hypothetical protein